MCPVRRVAELGSLYLSMPWCVSFEIWGEEFRPSRVPFGFTAQHDPGVIGTVGRYRGQPMPYGSASYAVPPSVPNRERITHGKVCHS